MLKSDTKYEDKTHLVQCSAKSWSSSKNSAFLWTGVKYLHLLLLFELNFIHIYLIYDTTAQVDES